MAYVSLTVFLFILRLLCQTPVQAQTMNIRPEIINYTNSQYQAESQNWSITQSEDDLLFFANNQGLLSYDGASWHLYPLPENQIVRSVASDGKGRIYAGGFGVFGYYQKKDFGGYQFHNLSQLVRDSMFGAEEIWKIIPENNFVLFQSFSRIHLLHGGTVKTLVAPGTILYTYPVRDQFYVQVLGKGLFRINESEKLEPVSNKPQLRHGRITMMLPYGTRELLIGTEKDGLLRFDPLSGQITAFPTAIDQELKMAEINNGVKLADNLYAIGTIGQGVFFMDAQGQLLAGVNKKTGLQNNTILGMYPDKEGNVWLAMDKGIAQLILKSNVAYYKDQEGTIGTVYAVAIYRHTLYVGSNHGLYQAPYNQMAHFELTDLKEVPGITGQVWDLKIIDSTLFCGNNTGTYRINQTGIEKISSLSGGWDLEPLIDPKTGKIKKLLQGTYNGIAVYEKNKAGWKFSHLLKGTKNMAVSRVRIASDGRIWAMHAYKGIYLLSADSGYQQVQNMVQLPLKNPGPTTLGWCLFRTGDQVRLSGRTGIYKWDNASNQLVRDKELEAYLEPYDNPRAIFTDEVGARVVTSPSPKKTAYWVLDKDKQLHYKNPDGEWTHFALNSHLFNLVTGFENIVSINPLASLLTGEDGFVILHKTERTLPVNLPSPSFRQISLIKEGKDISLPGSFVQSDGTLRLPYRSNNLKISYSLAAYDQPAAYSYRLLGSPEDRWSAYSFPGEKELNNLSAGNYKFQVKSNLSDKIATLEIQVLNPWYFSIVARILYLLLLLILILVLWRIHQHRLKLQRQTMTLKMREALQLQREKNANQLLVLEQQKLKGEVLHKSEDLAKLAMELIKKKKALKRFKEELDQMKTQHNSVSDTLPIDSRLQKLSKSLNKYIQDEESDWQLFDNGFSKVHEAFFEKLVQSYPDLTSQDLRLAAYLKMNLSTKEIAPLLNISVRGVEIKRYRLRKKLRLGPHDNLSDFMLRI